MDEGEFGNAEEQDLEAVFMGSAEEVAALLSVTPAGLRRLADIYDQVYPPIRRDPQQGRRRLWTFAAIARLRDARRLVQDGDVRSIKIALERARDGDARATQEGLALPSKGATQDALLLRLVEHVESLEARLEAMQRQLEAPRTDSSELSEQRKMNAYLLGELERRRLENEQRVQHRPWWQVWRTG